MNKRVREIRETAFAKKISQNEFGAKIGVSRDVINNIELGRVEPSDLLIKAIVREYGVDEHWLRTGEGQMFAPKTDEEETAAFFAEVLVDDDLEFIRRFASAFAKLSKEEKVRLCEIGEKIIDNMGK